MSRAPFVAVRTDIRKEERVGFIADFAGYNEDEAVGKLVRLWCWCADRKLEDAPDDCLGYAVPDAVVRRFLGPRGVEAILGDGCDELAMGERRSDGLIYLRGTADTVERLRGLRSSAAAGGQRRHETAARTAGRFVSTATSDGGTPTASDAHENVSHEQIHQLSTSCPPAVTSEIPDPRSLSGVGNLSLAGAREPQPAAPPVVPATIPPDGGKLGRGQPEPRATQQETATPGQRACAAVGNVAEPQIGPTPDRSDRPPSGGSYDDQDARARGRLAEATYRRVSDARIAIAADLKLPAPLPFPPLGPSSRAGSFRDLLDRVREEGAAAPLVCDRIVSNLVAQAREERSVEWLAEKTFGEAPWRTAREWMPGAAARRRGPAKGDPLPPAPPRRRDPQPAPIVVADDERAAVAQMAAELSARLTGPRAP